MLRYSAIANSTLVCTMVHLVHNSDFHLYMASCDVHLFKLQVDGVMANCTLQWVVLEHRHQKMSLRQRCCMSCWDSAGCCWWDYNRLDCIRNLLHSLAMACSLLMSVQVGCIFLLDNLAKMQLSSR